MPHTYTLFAPQGVLFASHVQFICTTGRVVFILFARQGVLRVGGMDVVWRINDDWGRIKFFE